MVQMNGDDTALIRDDGVPVATGHERGLRTTAPCAMQAAGRTGAFAVGGERGTMRACDADRDYVLELLNVAYSEGRLSKDEFDGRLENALSARTYADLDQIVTDLPAAPATAWPRW